MLSEFQTRGKRKATQMFAHDFVKRLSLTRGANRSWFDKRIVSSLLFQISGNFARSRKFPKIFQTNDKCEQVTILGASVRYVKQPIRFMNNPVKGQDPDRIRQQNGFCHVPDYLFTSICHEHFVSSLSWRKIDVQLCFPLFGLSCGGRWSQSFDCCILEHRALLIPVFVQCGGLLFRMKTLSKFFPVCSSISCFLHSCFTCKNAVPDHANLLVSGSNLAIALLDTKNLAFQVSSK